MNSAFGYPVGPGKCKKCGCLTDWHPTICKNCDEEEMWKDTRDEEEQTTSTLGR